MMLQNRDIISHPSSLVMLYPFQSLIEQRSNDMAQEYRSKETQTHDRELIQEINFFGLTRYDFTLGIFENDDKSFEVCSLDDSVPKYSSFGGSAGYKTATFKTLSECYGFISQGLKGEEDGDKEIWLNLVAV